MAIERNRFPDQIRIGAEAALPQAVAEHDDRMRARSLVFVRQKHSPRRSLHSQYVEVIPRNDEAKYGLVRVPSGQVQLRKGVCQKTGEDLVLIAVIDEVQMRGRKIARILGVCSEERHQTARLFDRQRLQQRGVDDAEDSGVGADAERQGERRNKGKSRTLEQYPESEANVLP